MLKFQTIFIILYHYVQNNILRQLVKAVFIFYTQQLIKFKKYDILQLYSDLKGAAIVTSSNNCRMTFTTVVF